MNEKLLAFESQQRESSLKRLNDSLMLAFNELASESEQNVQVSLFTSQIIL